MTMIHAIDGKVGSGKSTFAKQLEKSTNSLRLTHDEWMTKLYGSNPPESEFEICYARVSELIYSVAEKVLSLDREIILDSGFWTNEARNEIFKWAQKRNIPITMYHIHCEDSVRKERVLTRTNELPDGIFYIDESTLEILDSRWEPFSNEIPFTLIDTTSQKL